MKKYYRWSDNDKRFGPFIYAHEPNYRRWALTICSGDDENYPGCSLRISLGTHTFITVLPQIIKPIKIQYSGYSQSYSREYGFTYSDNFFLLRYGAQTHDSDTDKSKGWFTPWSCRRLVRRSLYDLVGNHYADLLLNPFKNGFNSPEYEYSESLMNSCPKASFTFKDFDGEEIVATTHIEEWEWHRGEGKFKWLSAFCKPQIIRSLEIRFMSETGPRKGSWKGGTIGHSIEMQPDELHEAAFKRYCDSHNMTFMSYVQQ